MRVRMARIGQTLRYVTSLRGLSPSVARFLWQARRHAIGSRDEFSLAAATRPAGLAALLAIARGRRAVVELGTGTGWSAVALALADGDRSVITYDAIARPEREDYLAMVKAGVRQRIELRDELDTSGPRDGESPELLFIDSSHDRESVLAAFSAWRGALAPGAVVVFHDYGHPDYPGVRDAVRELALLGDVRDGIFVWRAP
jgi:predicted O-methyltransferase YrrM